MNKIQLAIAAATAMSGALLPSATFAQVRHSKLKTAAAGVAGYEIAKHSHSKFLRKHRLAAGIVGAAVAHHYMKKHHH